MLEYPTITSQYLLAVVNQGRVCQATKVKKYYHKMVGGVDCSDLEQLKLTLLVYVLEQIYKLDMTCFDESPADTTLSYAQIFINHILVECKDCGYAFIPEYLSSTPGEVMIAAGVPWNDVPPAEGAGTDLTNLLLENGTTITLENNSGSLLLEN